MLNDILPCSARLSTILRLFFLPSHPSSSFSAPSKHIIDHLETIIPAHRRLGDGDIYANDGVDLGELFGAGAFAVRGVGTRPTYLSSRRCYNFFSADYVDRRRLLKRITPRLCSSSFILDSSSLTLYIFNTMRFCSGS